MICQQSKLFKNLACSPEKCFCCTQKQKLYSDEQIKSYYASRCPYGEWLDTNLIKLSDLPIPNKKVESYSQRMRDRLYRSFGYTYEEVKYTILPMAKNGIEPTSAMGTDIPLAALSDHHQPLFLYFKQLFAQVTIPPSIRCGKRLSRIPGYISVRMAICFVKQARTAGCWR